MRYNHDIRKKFQRAINIKQDNPFAQPAILGDGQGNVEAGDGEVYVRVNDQVFVVVNRRCAAVNELPVWVGYDPLQPQFLQVLSSREDSQARASTPVAHGGTHSWPELDTVWVELEQIMSYKIISDGALGIGVFGRPLYTGTAWVDLSLTDTSIPTDLGPYVPIAADQAAWVLVTISTAGVVTFTKGSEVTKANLALADIPAAPTGTRYVLAAVRVYTSQSVIFQGRGGSDILDLRYPLRAIYDDIYLRLDATNDPIIGALLIRPATDTASGLEVQDKDENVIASVDTVNNRVGVGTSSPDTTLQVVGNFRTGEDTTNYTNFDATGHQTMAGSARPWRDELGELLGKKKIGARITDDLAEGTVLFADNCQIADDWIITNVQLNHDKDLTGTISAHLHWLQDSANVPNWMIQYRWQINGTAKTTAWTSAKYSGHAFAYVSGTMVQITAFAAISPPAGTALSDIVQFRILRDTDNDSTLFAGSDPLTGNAAALMFDVHFQINSLGSNDEYTK